MSSAHEHRNGLLAATLAFVSLPGCSEGRTQARSPVERTATLRPMYFLSIAFHNLHTGEIRSPDTTDRARLEALVTQIEAVRSRNHMVKPPIVFE